MHETADDLKALDALLDASYDRAGPHLRQILLPDRRLSAERLAAEMTGVRILSLATVTAAGEPRVAPVDGVLFRGAWWFGSSPDSVRFRHIRARPAVSADHARGEELVVIVHGTAVEQDPTAPGNEGFRACLGEVYPDWEDWWSDTPPPYARIDAHTMFAAWLPTVPAGGPA